MNGVRFERSALVLLLAGTVVSAVCQWRLERKLNQILNDSSAVATASVNGNHADGVVSYTRAR